MKLDAVNLSPPRENSQRETRPLPDREPYVPPEDEAYFVLLAHEDSDGFGEDEPDQGTLPQQPLSLEDDGAQDGVSIDAAQQPQDLRNAAESLSAPTSGNSHYPREAAPKSPRTTPETATGKRSQTIEDLAACETCASDEMVEDAANRGNVGEQERGDDEHGSTTIPWRESPGAVEPAQAGQGSSPIEVVLPRNRLVHPTSRQPEGSEIPLLMPGGQGDSVVGDAKLGRGVPEGDRIHDSPVAGEGELPMEAAETAPMRSVGAGDEDVRLAVGRQGEEASSDADDRGAQDNPTPTPNTAPSLGEEILAGMNRRSDSATSDTEALGQPRLVRLVRHVVAQILVAENASRGMPEIRMVLKQSVLPDTEVVLLRQGAELTVRFVTRSEDSSPLLMLHRQLIQDELSQNLNCAVTVDVSAEHEDGRSRGQRDVYAEMEGDDS